MYKVWRCSVILLLVLYITSRGPCSCRALRAIWNVGGRYPFLQPVANQLRVQRSTPISSKDICVGTCIHYSYERTGRIFFHALVACRTGVIFAWIPLSWLLCETENKFSVTDWENLASISTKCFSGKSKCMVQCYSHSHAIPVQLTTHRECSHQSYWTVCLS